MHTYSMELGGRTLTMEIGKIAKQANGAVLVRYGDTAVVVAVTGTNSPSTRPTRTPAIGPSKGISEIDKAQEAPIIAGISGALSGSTDTAVATICTSL